VTESPSASVALLEHPLLEEPVATAPGGRSHRARRILRRLTTESALSFLLPFLAYVVVAVLLDFVFLSFLGDAVSRLADGYYVFYSGDPHLAAIGFVWNPLPSIAAMPFLLLTPLWPALASHIFAGSLTSALAMAGAVYHLRAMLSEIGVVRAPRLILTVLFAVNPMILYYGGNGMSEALYLFTLMATTRYLLRWLQDGRLRWLVFSGVWLGIAYLARNEAVGAGLVAVAVVAVVSFSRTDGPRRTRIWTSLTDMTIFLVPLVVSFGGWAIASLVITGQAFAQFTSQYGNTSQIRTQGLTPGHYGARLTLESQAIASLAPLLLVVLVVAAVVARRHRDRRILAPIAILGGALVFDCFSYLTNNLIWSFRFFITAAPLGVLLAGCCLARLQPARRATVGSDGHKTALFLRPFLRLPAFAAPVVLALALGLPSPLLTGLAMTNPNVGSLENQYLGYIFSRHPSSASLQVEQHFATVQSIDRYFSQRNFPDGSIIMDTFSVCAPDLVMSAPNPRIFMVTPERAFQKTLADPIRFHAPYLMIADPTGLNVLSALNIAYPTLFATGEGFARLVHDFPAAGECPEYRLYKAFRAATPAVGLAYG